MRRPAGYGDDTSNKRHWPDVRTRLGCSSRTRCDQSSAMPRNNFQMLMHCKPPPLPPPPPPIFFKNFCRRKVKNKILLRLVKRAVWPFCPCLDHGTKSGSPQGGGGGGGGGGPPPSRPRHSTGESIFYPPPPKKTTTPSCCRVATAPPPPSPPSIEAVESITVCNPPPHKTFMVYGAATLTRIQGAESSNALHTGGVDGSVNVPRIQSVDRGPSTTSSEHREPALLVFRVQREAMALHTF